MAVFMPAAFLPGLTGQMYAQFALVIAATALLSAINAATLKPTQCALWLRPPVPPEQAQLLLPRLQHGLCRVRARLYAADRRHGRPRQASSVDRRAGPDHRRRRLRPVACADRLPADRGSGLSAGHRAVAGRRRRSSAPRRCSTRSPRSRARRRAWSRCVTIAGVSALDNSASLVERGRRLCRC